MYLFSNNAVCLCVLWIAIFILGTKILLYFNMLLILCNRVFIVFNEFPLFFELLMKLS